MRENKSSPESVYKAFAEYYDAYVAGFEADLEIYLRLLKPGLKVLEIGCGILLFIQKIFKMNLFHLRILQGIKAMSLKM